MSWCDKNMIYPFIMRIFLMCVYVFGGLRPKLQDFTFYLACYYYSDDHAILICEYNYSTILRSNNSNNIFISAYIRKGFRFKKWLLIKLPLLKRLKYSKIFLRHINCIWSIFASTKSFMIIEAREIILCITMAYSNSLF